MITRREEIVVKDRHEEIASSDARDRIAKARRVTVIIETDELEPGEKARMLYLEGIYGISSENSHTRFSNLCPEARAAWAHVEAGLK